MSLLDILLQLFDTHGLHQLGMGSLLPNESMVTLSLGLFVQFETHLIELLVVGSYFHGFKLAF